MKTTTLKTLVATLFVSLVLSSCLGDNNSKIENGNALTYVQERTYGQNVAITNSIAFSNDYVNKLEPGEFYFLDFSVHTKDGQDAEGVYVARRVGPVGDGTPIARGNFNTERPQTEVDVYPTQMNIALFSPSEKGLDENWVFEYECKVYKEDKVKDANGQDNIRVTATLLQADQSIGTGENVKPLDKNKVIVRLYLERYDTSRPVDDTVDKVAHKGIAKINLQHLRSYLRSNIGNIGTDGALGIIQFKYIVNINKENEEVKTEAKYLGNLSDERPDFYMLLRD